MTKTKNAFIVNKNDVTINSYLDVCLDEDVVLDFTEINSSTVRCLGIFEVEYGEVNFERLSDWKRLINKLDNYNTKTIQRLICGDKKKVKYDGFTIKPIDFNYSDDGFEIEFDKPTKLVVEKIGDELVLIEIKKLIGNIDWEWYYRGGGINNYANVLSIYISEINIVD